jgi:molecular chaperone Hsp33
MDELIRVLAKEAHVKAVAITAKGMVERARNIHRLMPLGTAALGRALMAASMMGCQLKEEHGAVTLTFKGGGPLGTVMAVADHLGNARGYLTDGSVELPLKAPGKLDVGSGVGVDGTLTVIKDIGLKEPYVGTVPLVSGEIAEDVTSYFAISEQIPSACALGVLVGTDCSVVQAGGYLIQLLPGATEGEIQAIEAGVAQLGALTAAMDAGMDSEGMLRTALGAFELEVVERAPVEYRCYCSRERMERALRSMGAKDLGELIEEQGEAELTCQFCDKVYHFAKPELEALLLG